MLTLDDLVDRLEQQRLSDAKLAEPYSDRPAQRQVLSNLLYDYGVEVPRNTRKAIREGAMGRPLQDPPIVIDLIMRLEEGVTP